MSRSSTDPNEASEEDLADAGGDGDGEVRPSLRPGARGAAKSGPSLGELAHDLRNLVGLVRALAEELPTRVRPIDVDAGEVLADLQAQSKLAMDALWLLEHWSDPLPTKLSLGAWAWALRLEYRELSLGSSLARAPSLHAVTGDVLRAGTQLLRALGHGRRVAVELDEAEPNLVRFVGPTLAPRTAALNRARRGLEDAGLVVRVDGGSPCAVRVGVRVSEAAPR